jgi:hypothetical protein
MMGQQITPPSEIACCGRSKRGARKHYRTPKTSRSGIPRIADTLVFRKQGLPHLCWPPSPAGDSNCSGRGHRPPTNAHRINLLSKFKQEDAVPPLSTDIVRAPPLNRNPASGWYISNLPTPLSCALSYLCKFLEKIKVDSVLESRESRASI